MRAHTHPPHATCVQPSTVRGDDVWSWSCSHAHEHALMLCVLSMMMLSWWWCPAASEWWTDDAEQKNTLPTHRGMERVENNAIWLAAADARRTTRNAARNNYKMLTRLEIAHAYWAINVFIAVYYFYSHITIPWCTCILHNHTQIAHKNKPN